MHWKQPSEPDSQDYKDTHMEAKKLIADEKSGLISLFKAAIK